MKKDTSVKDFLKFLAVGMIGAFAVQVPAYLFAPRPNIEFASVLPGFGVLLFSAFLGMLILLIVYQILKLPEKDMRI